MSDPQPISSTKTAVFVAVAAIVFFAGAAAGQTLLKQDWVRSIVPDVDAPAQTTVKVVSEESAVIDAVKKASPAVVSIVATADVPKLERCFTNPFGNNNPFGMNFRMPSTCQNGTEKQQVSAGSGYLVTDDGYIMTNKHVVDGADGTEYTVILNDDAHKGKNVTATVLAADPTNDIAVLKIDETGLPFLTFADSDALQPGQTAIAIGYALGEFENSVSKGVVSGLSRQIDAGGGNGGSEHLYDIIQTDAAINPGNSGGPLLDISGNVIGMNVAVANAQSIAFAIPANDVKDVFDSVKEDGKIERAFLGVRYVPIDADLQKQQDLAYDYGALVVRGDNVTDLAVTPGSPADKAGLVENDIVLAWNGQKIDADHSIAELVSRAKVGDTVTLKISHKGEEQDVSVTLTARPTE